MRALSRNSPPNECLLLADSGLNDLFIEFRPMFNRPPHLALVWEPFFVAVEAGPPRAGLPFLGCLATDVHLSCLKMRDPTARFLSAIYFQVLVLLSWNGGKISVMRKNAGRKLLN